MEKRPFSKLFVSALPRFEPIFRSAVSWGSLSLGSSLNGCWENRKMWCKIGKLWKIDANHGELIPDGTRRSAHLAISWGWFRHLTGCQTWRTWHPGFLTTENLSLPSSNLTEWPFSSLIYPSMVLFHSFLYVYYGGVTSRTSRSIFVSTFKPDCAHLAELDGGPVPLHRGSVPCQSHQTDLATGFEVHFHVQTEIGVESM